MPTLAMPRPRRVAAIFVVVSLLLAAWAVSGPTHEAPALPDEVEAIPDSASCLFAAGALAGATFLTVKSPPAGFWAIVITTGTSALDVADAVAACGAWFTTPLGQVLPTTPAGPSFQIRGHGGCGPCVAHGGHGIIWH